MHIELVQEQKSESLGSGLTCLDSLSGLFVFEVDANFVTWFGNGLDKSAFEIFFASNNSNLIKKTGIFCVGKNT